MDLNKWRLNLVENRGEVAVLQLVVDQLAFQIASKA